MEWSWKFCYGTEGRVRWRNQSRQFHHDDRNDSYDDDDDNDDDNDNDSDFDIHFAFYIFHAGSNRPLLVHFPIRTPSSTMHVRTDFRSYYFTLQHLKQEKYLQIQSMLFEVLAIKIVISSIN